MDSLFPVEIQPSKPTHPISMKNTLLALVIGLAASSVQAGTEISAKNPLPPATPPAPACNTISYDFVELQYQHLFADGEDSDGVGAHFSKSIVGSLFGFASYNKFFNDADFWSVDAGLGYHIPLTSCADLVVKGAVVYDEDNFDSAVSGSTGIGVRLGLAQWLQLDVFYHAFFYEFEDMSSSGSAALIFREVVAPKIDIIVAGSVGQDDYQDVSAGFRYNF